MKIYEFFLDENTVKSFNFSIRNKIDFAKLILLTSQHLLIYDGIKDTFDDMSYKLKIKVKVSGKTSRLYFYNKNRFFSVLYPIKMKVLDSGELELTSSNTNHKINNQTVAFALSIIEDQRFIDHPYLADYFLEYNPTDNLDNYDNAIEIGVQILEDLFKSEPSYIRYDYDEEHESKGDTTHPLNHLDINYSSNSTYKLGLTERINETEFEDMLNLETNCHFVRKSFH